MKTWHKWTIGIIASPFVLIILLITLLYIPPIQRWAVGVASEYASKATGMHISIDNVHLRFPLDLELGGVKAIKPDSIIPQRKDTVLHANSILCDIQLLPLFKSKVEVDALQLDGVKLNTIDFIAAARVKGKVDNLLVRSHGIDLKVDSLLLNTASMSGADLDIALNDSVPEDTTTSENYWKIRLNELKIEDSSVKIHMPGDSLSLGISLANFSGKNGYFDLGKRIYQLKSLDVHNGKATMDNRYEPFTEGFDTNHLDIRELNLGVDDLYYSEEKTSLFVRACSFKEKSGLTLSSFTSHLAMDAKSLRLPDLQAATPNSAIKAEINMDLNCLDTKDPGILSCNVDARFGKQDIMLFLGGMPQSFKRDWPSYPLTVKGSMRGNMKKCNLAGINIQLPTAFRVNLNGNVSNLDDMDNLACNLNLDAASYNVRFITGVLDPSLMKTINIPSGITAKGNVKVAKGSIIDAILTMTEGGGRMNAKAHFDAKAMAYNADIDARNINLGHFVKGMGLGVFSGNLTAKGKGTDPFASSTTITADASLGRIQYDGYDLRDLDAIVRIANHKAHFDVKSSNELLDGNIILEALMNPKDLRATLIADIKNLNLYKLRISEQEASMGLCCHLDMESDLNDYYKLEGSIADLRYTDSVSTYLPNDVLCDIFTHRDSTHAIIECGDLMLNADAQGGYKKLMKVSDNIMNEIQRQMAQRTIDQHALRSVLPIGRVYFTSGKENPLARTLNAFGYGFSYAKIDLTSSPADGVNGFMDLDTLLIGKDMQLDEIRVRIDSDDEKMNYAATIKNGKDNPQVSFTANLDGHIIPSGTSAYLSILDANDRKGISLGLQANVEQQGIRMNIDHDTPTILGYKEFKVNKDNYLFMSDDMRVSANLDLRSADGMALQVYTDDDNIEALQDITLSLSRFELAELTSVLPYMPKISGAMDGDFHMIMNEKDLSVSSSVDFRKLTYEGYPMGDISSEFIYIPKEDGTHYIDGILYKSDIQVCSLTGSYDPQGNGNIDATLSMEHLPLELVNGFVPDQIMGLKGYGDGDLHIRGSLDKPVVDGELKTDSAYIVSVPYGVQLRFADDPIRIVGSHLVFENFKLYAANNQPLTCNGDCNFADLDHIKLNMRMIAKNFMLIDAKENRRSEAYGRGYVNFYGMIDGELDKLSVRGKLEVLAKSDIYYILRDTPLTTDNRLKELVSFTDFTDETTIEEHRPTVDGMKIDMNISVAAGTHIKCWMNTDHSNYLDLIGNGDLRMIYSGSDMSITGRYTITEGEMKYSLPVIPLKTFKISEGSYLEFTGDVMNPRLNIKAQETTKANVNLNGINRLVEFNCGVVITKTLNDMGLEFVIDAPEEQSLHDELQQMSIEERGKLAVTMLTTGMYLADGNTSAFTMNSALSSFLQQEINNIAGSALKTLDLSIGLENSTDEFGSMHTDYSFKFAKRFWNNRLSISVGGKISTGPDVSGQNQSFFDNVEVQYRLGDDSNQYLRLFYDRAVYDFLEGYTGQYGAGYMWKRKLRHFKDIFSLKDSDALIVPRKETTTNSNDSTSAKTE